MGRAPRAAVGNIVYHVLNRANGRMKIFRKDKDYEIFEKILAEAKKKQPMRILTYCLMPNHWHLVLNPYKDDDLSNFMRWVTLTHTQRWHAHYKSIGYGHLYQGRYRSFPVQRDKHFLQWVNEPQPKEEVEVIRYAIQRGRPYGNDIWLAKTVQRLGLETTVRQRGGYRR